ncbi:MAG: putative beta-lysine N-acetyltransferase [Clostridia bacterium]|nr:putative beta-lysine N-acetyltransferase [Clostridia bacterium]
MNALQYNACYKMDYNDTTLYFDYPNKRLKILEHNEVPENVVQEIIAIAAKEGLGKIITYCRIRELSPFRACGFVVEGMINGFFKGENTYCLSYFIDKQRSISLYKEEEDSILSSCMNDIQRFNYRPNKSYPVRKAKESDIPQMIAIFTETFKTYPSPVYNAEYLKNVMEDQVLFMVAEDKGRIVSIASAELDIRNSNAEITDCATYPEYQGKGLLTLLIHCLQSELSDRGFHTLYSLSRAIHPGINKALRKCGYKYGGRLIKNCHICGDFEDMNIWFKQLMKGG